MKKLAVYFGDELGSYGYQEKPWFLPHERLQAFFEDFDRRGLRDKTRLIRAPRCSDEDILLFHTPQHLERVRRRCAENIGALDHGPTFARRSIEAAANYVVGAVTDATRRILSGELQRAFVPIAGFHHAHPELAHNYCLYNDCAIALRLMKKEGVRPLAYVDVDLHFADGVYAAVKDDPDVVFVDTHAEEDGGQGANEQKPGKLNLILRSGCTDEEFLRSFQEAERLLAAAQPKLILFEAGCDALAGDPMSKLRLTPAFLAEVTKRLIALADSCAEGRMLVVGGGGYAKENLGPGWGTVVECLMA